MLYLYKNTLTMKKIKTLNEELKRMRTLLVYETGTSFSDTLDEQTRIGTKRKYIRFDWGKGKPITLRKKRNEKETLEMVSTDGPELGAEEWDKFLKNDGRITRKMDNSSKNIWESLKNSDKSLSDCDEECQKQKGFAVASLEFFDETNKKFKWQKVVLGETKREDTTPPTPPDKYPGLKISLPFTDTPSSDYFENDEWEVTSLLKEEVSEIISKLRGEMSEFNCDDEEDRAYLDNISISTSASRLRNGESHTWLELSKKRNNSALEYISNQLKSIGVAMDGDTKINQKFDGENGDGSSGPNPPKGYKVSENGSKDSVIENPTEEDRNIKGKPYGSIEEYEKHKYCNIKLDVIINHCEVGGGGGEPDSDSLEFEDYKITFSSQRPGLTIHLPKILANWDKKDKQKNYKRKWYSCPFFDQGKLTRKGKKFEKLKQKLLNR